MSPKGKAVDCDSTTRGFKSRHSPFFFLSHLNVILSLIMIFVTNGAQMEILFLSAYIETKLITIVNNIVIIFLL